MIVPVILSGGSGTRLWPLSRQNLPKQFLALAGSETLFQQTIRRAAAVPGATPPLVVASDDHRFLAGEQLQALGVTPRAIVLEPLARNTAPAIALAALQVAEREPSALLLVLPADHRIGAPERWVAAVQQARPTAEAGALVSFGIAPTEAHTGYGYIRCGAALADGVFAVERFVEKPDAATARAYLADGRYVWNAGIFLFRADRYLEELAEHAPAMLTAARAAMAQARADLDFIRVDREAFAASPSDSIDYAVMEKTRRAAVVPVDCDWNDIGSWSALWAIGPQDAAGNVISGDVLARDTRDCLLHAVGDHLIATVGVRDLVIVDTPDATLVAHRDRVQDVKAIVDSLKAADRGEHVNHRQVYRPWGHYDSVDRGEHFQVKRIVVKPGASLSLQKHAHRAEHWIVVDGVAEVTCDERVFRLEKNQSTYIPKGSVHRLKNPGTEPLALIEVQSGDYLGEDDIVRLDDVYGRHT